MAKDNGQETFSERVYDMNQTVCLAQINLKNESPAGQTAKPGVGARSTRARSWQRIAMLLACAGVVLGVAGPATGGLFSKKSSKKSAQLLCVGTVRYQFGKAAWASQENGNIPILLPVSVQTDKFPSQLIVPQMGVFQANANTRFTLNMDASQQFQLTIQQGAVFYSLTNGATMRITSPLPGVGANVAGPDAKSTNGAWSSLPADQYVGQTSFEKENLFQLVNMNGRAQVDRNGRTVRNVGQGHTLFVSLAQKPDQATTGTATLASAASHGYIFQENPVNRNPLGVLNPMSGSAGPSSALRMSSGGTSGDYDSGGFGGGGYGGRRQSTSNTPASPAQ